MIPGKKYKPEDFVEIAWRRKWMIVVPFVLCTVVTILWGRTLPNRYRSEALVLVVPPQVSEALVQSTTTGSVLERILLMREQIINRTKLEQLIAEFDLYAGERKRLPMEQVLEMMRRDINVELQKTRTRQEPGYFTVSYESVSAKSAVLVAERVASLFVRESLVGRSVQADSATMFLDSQLGEALHKLQDHEARLAAFRRTYAGRLPEEVAANLELMQSARQEVQANTDGINRDRDRQLTIERSIADELALGPTVSAPQAGRGVPIVFPAAQQLTAAQATLVALQLRLKDDHPDVRSAKSRIAALEKKAAAEAMQQPLSGVNPAIAMNPADADRLRRISSLQAEFDSLERFIALKRAKVEKAQAAITDYQRRVESSPTLQSQLSALMRDYGTLKTSYESLLEKSQTAKLAMNLEQRQIGEQLRIIDPARFPERPRSPNRSRLTVTGAIFGLGLGVLLAGLLEYRDTSLRVEEDVLVALSLPVLALVPTIRTSHDARQGRRRRLLIASSAAAMILLSLAGVAWKLRLFEQWGR